MTPSEMITSISLLVASIAALNQGGYRTRQGNETETEEKKVRKGSGQS